MTSDARESDDDEGMCTHEQSDLTAEDWADIRRRRAVHQVDHAPSRGGGGTHERMPMTMYCVKCGARAEIPNTAAFPQQCANCYANWWSSMPVAPRVPGDCPLCEGTGKLVQS